MAENEARLAESRWIARTIILVAERVKADLAHIVVPFDLPVPLARALMVLAEPTPMRDLAEQLGCEPSYITGLADQLEQRGLVIRVPGQDRRVKLLEITPEGSALRDRITDAIASRAIIERRLDDDERAGLVRLLERLLEP